MERLEFWASPGHHPAMVRFCCLGLLCLIGWTQFAGAGDTPELSLEEGILAYEVRNELNHAKALLREIVATPQVPPRTAAEVLWHMAEIYRLQGSDEASMLVLRKLGQTFPNAPPYTAAATTAAVELSRDLGSDIHVPNAADVFTARELVRIVRGALRLNDAGEATAALRDLQEIFGSILFELAIPIPDETPANVKERADATNDYSAYQAWVRQLLERLESQPPKALVPLAETTLVKEMLDQGELDETDFNLELITARDALTEALATAEAARVTGAVTQFQTLLQPLIEGPPALAQTMAQQGEAAALQKVLRLAQTEQFGEALRVWRQARMALLNSGVGGRGLVPPDAEAIPPRLRPRLIGALMFVEAALYSLSHEDNVKGATKELAEACGRLGKLLPEAPDEACRHRLEQMITRLQEAGTYLKARNLGRAQDLMQTECYSSQ